MKKILEAAREQIIKMLEGDLYAKNFSNVIRVAKMAEEIAAADGRPELVQVKGEVLEESEFRVPILHEALLADFASGDDVLASKYKRIQRAHTELEQQRLLVEATGGRLESERAVIHEERKAMRKVHEALALGSRDGLDLPCLPPIPELPPHPTEEEEEEEDIDGD